jgi:hypothetical protein
MKNQAGLEVKHHIFITSALNGDEWSASIPNHFTPSGYIAACLMLVFCLTNASTLMMEATRSPEMSVDFQHTIQQYIPENITPE